MKVSVYDRKTKKRAFEFYLAAFVDEKVVALRYVDLSFMPELKPEDVDRELQRFAQIFKDEISQTMVVESAEEVPSTAPETRKRRSRQEQ